MPDYSDTRIQFRRGSYTQWANSNPVLASGEPGFDLTNNILKVGDGSTQWASLSGVGGGGGGGNGSTTFVGLLDTPSNFTGAGSKIVAVNSAASALEYITVSSLSITESQISDLGSYLTSVSISDIDSNVIVTETEGIASNDNDTTIPTSAAVKAYVDLNAGGSEVNDLTSSVTWANVPDANITESSVVQHSGALQITESQIADFGTYLTAVADDTSPFLGGELNLDNNDIVIDCRNDSGSDILAGTPVYVSGYYANGKSLIAPADASSASTMPAIGIVNNTITNGGEGTVGIMGVSKGFSTNSFEVGDTVYIANGGGLTNVKPTGVSDRIQNLGRVLRKDASNGSIILLGAGRSNDVPNSATFTGDVEAASFTKTGGSSSEFLKADGSVDSSTYLTSVNINIVDDTTPQLGGNLDLQTYDITSSGTTGGDLKIGINPVGIVYDAHTLITDNANARVGICIDSPSYALDIGTNNGSTDSSIRVQKIVPLDTVLIGTAHTTTGFSPMSTHYGSVLFGNGASPTTSKCFSYATNYFSAAGDAQKVSTVVQYETTDATTKYLNAAKTGNYLYSTYVRNDTFILEPDSSATFTIHLIANNDTDGTSAGWIFRGCVKSVNKSLSFVGSPITENFADSGMSSATAAIEVQDGSGVSAFRKGGLVIKVNGLTSKTIRWVATIDAVLTSF